MRFTWKNLAGLLLCGAFLPLFADRAAESDALRTQAVGGIPEAAFRLGNEYFYGEHRTRNYTLAAYWYKKAADSGLPEAQFNYACCLESGRGVKPSAADAFAWYQKAAVQGFEPAALRVAKFHLTGIRDEHGKMQLRPSPASALEILERLAARSYAPAQMELAAFLMRSNATETERRRAFTLLTAVTAKQECPPAAFRMLADCYFVGFGCTPDHDKMLKLLNAAAARGDAEAMAKLGYLYEHGKIAAARPDPVKARGYYERAARAGHPMAQFKYAEAVAEGCYPGKGLPEALKWYRKAAANRCPQALFQLGVMYCRGTGVTKDLPRAADYFFQAAKMGYARAQYNLACLFADGAVGGKPDQEAAFFWFLEAAKRGDAAAQARVADCYLTGTGVDSNVSEAEKWLEKAARQGDFASGRKLLELQRAAPADEFF